MAREIDAQIVEQFGTMIAKRAELEKQASKLLVAIQSLKATNTLNDALSSTIGISVQMEEMSDTVDELETAIRLGIACSVFN